jgi:aquaporin Z
MGALLAAFFTHICRAQERHGVENVIPNPSAGTQAVCEFLGSFMLVLTVGLNLAVDSPAAAWSISAALMCMIYALGDVSGGHFNPAVTLAIFLCGKDPDKNTKGLHYVRQKTAVYMTAQMIGGLLAGFLYECVHCSVSKDVAYFKLLGTGPGVGYTWEQVAIAEVFFTFVLVFTVLSVAVYTKEDDFGQRDYLTRHKNHAALAIGLCVMAGGGAIGNVSGAHLNPAVSMGISSGASLVCSTHESVRWANCLLYMIFQIGGSAIAAVVYFATHPGEIDHVDVVK